MVTVAVMHDGSTEIARASKTLALKPRTMCRKVATLTSPPRNLLILFCRRRIAAASKRNA